MTLRSIAVASGALSLNEALRFVGRDALLAMLEGAAGAKKPNKVQRNRLQRRGWWSRRCRPSRDTATTVFASAGGGSFASRYGSVV